jgi:hypothetical protein
MSDVPAHEHFPYPRGDVVGVFADRAAFDVARERLAQAAFGSEQYEVLHGEDDLARLDTTGEAHGWMGRVFRTLQNVVTDEGEHARRYAESLREGAYIIGVAVGDDEPAKQRATAALRAAHPHFLFYYATNYIEDLGAEA